MEILLITGGIIGIGIGISIAKEIVVSIGSTLAVIVIKRTYVKIRKKIRLIKYNYKEHKLLLKNQPEEEEPPPYEDDKHQIELDK